MTNATRVVVATFGVVAGLAGLEHGVGEIMQGNVASDGLMILSWPRSEFFRILGEEPAMTIVPSLLASGILAIAFCLIFIVWAARFVQRQNGGLVLILLSIVMLLVGAGFGPPLLGISVGVAATRINGSRVGWRAHLPVGVRRLLASLWPWSFGAAVIAWLGLLPGMPLLDYTVGANNPISDALVYTVILCAFGFLLVTIVTGLAHDSQREMGSPSGAFDERAAGRRR